MVSDAWVPIEIMAAEALMVFETALPIETVSFEAFMIRALSIVSVGAEVPPGINIIPVAIVVHYSRMAGFFPQMNLIGFDQRVGVVGLAERFSLLTDHDAGNSDFSAFDVDGRIQQPVVLHDESSLAVHVAHGFFAVIKRCFKHEDVTFFPSVDRPYDLPTPDHERTAIGGGIRKNRVKIDIRERRVAVHIGNRLGTAAHQGSQCETEKQPTHFFDWHCPLPMARMLLAGTR